MAEGAFLGFARIEGGSDAAPVGELVDMVHAEAAPLARAEEPPPGILVRKLDVDRSGYAGEERRGGSDRRWGTHEKAGLNRNRRNGMDRRSPEVRECLISIYLQTPNPDAPPELRQGYIGFRYEDGQSGEFVMNLTGRHDEHQLAAAIRAVQDLFNGKHPTPPGGFDRPVLARRA